MTIETPTLIVASACLGYVLLLGLHWNTWGRGWKVPQTEEDLQSKYNDYK